MKSATKTPSTTKIPNTLEGQYAGFVSRFLAYIIDLLVLIAILVVVGITVDLILQFFSLGHISAQIQTLDNILGDIARLIAVLGSITFISASYFVLGWTATGGQSVGKILLGLRIVPLDGSKMGFIRSIIRFIGFMLSAFCLFIGLLWVLISDTRQGWHDKIARTCVIYNWPARENYGAVEELRSRWEYIKHTRRHIRARRAAKSRPIKQGETKPDPEEM